MWIRKMDTMEVEDFRVENTVLKAVVAIDSKVEIVLVMDTKVVDGVLEVAVDTIVEVVMVMNTEVVDTRLWIRRLWIRTKNGYNGGGGFQNGEYGGRGHGGAG
ncbi:hypothetical protein Bca101_080740 [Brassica carinata]